MSRLVSNDAFLRPNFHGVLVASKYIQACLKSWIIREWRPSILRPWKRLSEKATLAIFYLGATIVRSCWQVPKRPCPWTDTAVLSQSEACQGTVARGALILIIMIPPSLESCSEQIGSANLAPASSYRRTLALPPQFSRVGDRAKMVQVATVIVRESWKLE